MTIASVSALIAVLNEFTNVLLIHGEVKPAELSLVSSEFTENMIRDAVYAGHDWLTLDQGELRVRVPLAAVDYEELRQDLDEDDEWLEFTRAGMRTTFGGGVVEFGVGSPLPSGSAFSVRVAEGPYEPNLVPIVEAENLLRPDPDLESIAAWFDRPAWAVVVVVTGLVVVAASALLHTTERNQPVP